MDRCLGSSKWQVARDGHREVSVPQVIRRLRRRQSAGGRRGRRRRNVWRRYVFEVSSFIHYKTFGQCSRSMSLEMLLFDRTHNTDRLPAFWQAVRQTQNRTVYQARLWWHDKEIFANYKVTFSSVVWVSLSCFVRCSLYRLPAVLSVTVARCYTTTMWTLLSWKLQVHNFYTISQKTPGHFSCNLRKLFRICIVVGRGYNKNWVLYPRPLTCQKELLLFYMYQLWALQVITTTHQEMR